MVSSIAVPGNLPWLPRDLRGLGDSINLSLLARLGMDVIRRHETAQTQTRLADAKDHDNNPVCNAPEVLPPVSIGAIASKVTKALVVIVGLITPSFLLF
jgi:hypothetical protein